MSESWFKSCVSIWNFRGRSVSVTCGTDDTLSVPSWIWHTLLLQNVFVVPPRFRQNSIPTRVDTYQSTEVDTSNNPWYTFSNGTRQNVRQKPFQPSELTGIRILSFLWLLPLWAPFLLMYGNGLENSIHSLALPFRCARFSKLNGAGIKLGKPFAYGLAIFTPLML